MNKESGKRKHDETDDDHVNEITKKAFALDLCDGRISDMNISPIGFNRGLAPQEVVGAMVINGTLMLLVKWDGVDIVDSHCL